VDRKTKGISSYDMSDGIVDKMDGFKTTVIGKGYFGVGKLDRIFVAANRPYQ